MPNVLHDLDSFWQFWLACFEHSTLCTVVRNSLTQKVFCPTLYWTKKNFLNFLWTFILRMNFSFHTMTLDWYFKRKDSLSNPHGDLSLTINPAVITAMNHEVTREITSSTMSGSGQAAGAKKHQPYWLINIVTISYLDAITIILSMCRV